MQVSQYFKGMNSYEDTIIELIATYTVCARNGEEGELLTRLRSVMENQRREIAGAIADLHEVRRLHATKLEELRKKPGIDPEKLDKGADLLALTDSDIGRLSGLLVMIELTLAGKEIPSL